MRRIFFFLVVWTLLLACTDDNSFSTDSHMRLAFSTDTVQFDTIFSKVPSSTYTFWVYNHHHEGLRLSSVRLSRRNQTGFRVNVDGTYLDNAMGSLVNNLEIRAKDSLLVFVELTSPEAMQQEPKLLEDDLVFVLENGTEQKVNLRAWIWDAQRWYMPVIDSDTLIESSTPIIIYGQLTVEESAHLQLRNTTLYFHDQAGIEVHGDLSVSHCLLRGDRLDHMFSYLPYDRISGQWKGIHFYQTSRCNDLYATEIRNAENAILLDSASLDSADVRLLMTQCIIHNAKGYGIRSVNANIQLRECQITNTLAPCVAIIGGQADISYCTLAQFYPFSADRGAALYFSNFHDGSNFPLVSLVCEGVILTGYDDDVVQGNVHDESVDFEYRFSHSLLRTPKIDTADSVRFSNIIWESPKDSIQGIRHFKTIDEKNLYYDFHLDSLSTAQGLGCYR